MSIDLCSYLADARHPPAALSADTALPWVHAILVSLGDPAHPAPIAAVHHSKCSAALVVAYPKYTYFVDKPWLTNATETPAQVGHPPLHHAWRWAAGGAAAPGDLQRALPFPLRCRSLWPASRPPLDMSSPLWASPAQAGPAKLVSWRRTGLALLASALHMPHGGPTMPQASDRVPRWHTLGWFPTCWPAH